MINDRKRISFTRPLLALCAFAFTLWAGGTLLAQAHKHRQQQVHDQYQREVQEYIHANQSGLETIFTFFDKDYCKEASQPDCQLSKGQRIARLISDNLKDFSSTAFIHLNADGKLVLMRLSGETEILGNWPDNSEVVSLLQGKRDTIAWADYLWIFPNKEVVVPVKNQNNQVVGAIVRGVIE